MYLRVEFDDKAIKYAMRRGCIMESSVAAAAAADICAPIERSKSVTRIIATPIWRLGATPDFIIRRDGDSGLNVGILQLGPS